MDFLNHTHAGDEGRHLLFLHGLNESMDGYQPLMEELQDEMRVHAVDLRGHGNSKWRPPYTLSGYMADVLEHIDDEIGSSVILSGHSLGGLVSAGIAAKHPELVLALILEDPPFYTVQLPVLRESPFHGLFLSVRDMLKRHRDSGGSIVDLQQLVDRWRVEGSDSPLLRDAYGEGYVTRLASDLHRTDPRTLDAVLEGALFDGLDPDAMLSEVRCPVLLVAGNNERGGALQEDDIDRAASLLQDVEVMTVDDAGHEIHTTRPEWFASTLREFLVSRDLLA